MSEFDIVINLDNNDLAKAISSTGEFRASVKDLILDNVSEQIEEKLEDVLDSRNFDRAVESIIDNYDMSDTVKDEVSNALGDMDVLTEQNFEELIRDSDALKAHFTTQDEVSNAIRELVRALTTVAALINKEEV
tara:strand:+ start:1128 stop:1529 length:402 start_codon:yes stop_codon:yes gene_type:complete